MPKSKQTKAVIKLDKRKKTKIIIVVLIVTLGGMLFAAFVYATNKNHAQEEKDMLIRSSVEMENVFNDFSAGMVYEKKDEIKSPNTCSNDGVKYSKEYVCGNSFELTVLSISEAQYRELDNKFIGTLKANSQFKTSNIHEPEYSESTGKLVASSGSSFADTKITCVTASYYHPADQTARFTANCKDTASEQLFPLN